MVGPGCIVGYVTERRRIGSRQDGCVGLAWHRLDGAVQSVEPVAYEDRMVDQTGQPAGVLVVSPAVIEQEPAGLW